MFSRRRILTLALLFQALSSLHAGDAYQWSVKYLIDNSREVLGRSQKVFPRHGRSLALSPDGKYLYVGYLHSFERGGEVRRIQLDVAGYEAATLTILPGPVAKAMATDDKGRVFICSGGEILVYGANLDERQFTLRVGTCEGVAVSRENGKLILYGSDREAGTVQRWELTETNGTISAAHLAGFGGSGTFRVPGAVDLRGLRVDAKGRVFVADLKGDKIFRIERDGAAIQTASVKSPMDIGLDGDRLLVTGSSERAVTVLGSEMNVIGSLNVPWAELELSPVGNNHLGALAGIAVTPGKGFYVANEGGQTANQKSTYGEADDRSDFVEGKLFRDATQDDNEPILQATAVTTAP